MKQIVIYLFALFFPLLNFSQDNKAAQKKIITTEEEYNYLTKGYPSSLKFGLDFKSGYHLTPILKDEKGPFIIEYQLLFHEESQENRAVSIIITEKKRNRSNKVYLCLPFNNKNLFGQYYNATVDLGANMSYAYELSNSVLFSTLVDEKFNK